MRINHGIVRGLVTGLLALLPGLLLAAEGPKRATGAAIRVHVRADPESIELHATTDGSSATYKSGFTLTPAANLSAVLSVGALKEVRGVGREIPVTSIHLDSGGGLTALTKELPKLVAVTVETNVLRGRFCGSIHLTSSTALDRGDLPLCITLTPKPNLVTLPSVLNFRLTRCSSWLDCRITAWFIPVGQTDRALRWQIIDAGHSGNAPAVPAQVTVHGDRSGAIVALPVGQPNGTDAVATLPNPLTASDTGILDLAFLAPPELTADHYQGQYPLAVPDGPVTLAAVGIDVRNGPLLALVVLLAGIMLGRLLQASNSALNQSQTRLLDRYTAVVAEVSRIQDPVNQRILALNLDDVRADIRTMVRIEADIMKDLNLVESLAVGAGKLDRWVPQVNSEPDLRLRQQLQAVVAAARAAINVKDLATADQQIRALIGLLGQSQGPDQQAVANADRAGLSLQRGASGRAGADADAQNPPRSGIRDLFARLMEILYGTQPLGLSWYYYARPIFYSLLLIGLALLGLYTLYLQNATFGAAGPFDYLSLFLWGLSADIAQKTLQGLTLGMRPG